MKREKERDRRREAGGRWQLNGGHRGSFTAIVKGEVRTMSERERERKRVEWIADVQSKTERESWRRVL